MKEYQRTSLPLPPGEFPAEDARAAGDFMQRFDLGGFQELTDAALAACETRTKRLRRHWWEKLLRRRIQIETMRMLVSPRVVLCVQRKENGAVKVIWRRLAECELKEYKSGVIEDDGVNVLGTGPDENLRSREFLGLGPEPAAEKFRETLLDAYRRARAAA